MEIDLLDACLVWHNREYFEGADELKMMSNKQMIANESGVAPSKLAPIVLFVYNRPEHTSRTIKALKLNTLASQSDLIVYSDGAKNQADRAKVNEVRNHLLTISGFLSVTIREAEKNLGLARSIIEGVTHVIEAFGRAIILEDDLLVAPYFLAYMNDALDHYAEVEHVMHVSGYMYPIDHEGLTETFLLRFPSSWGWATWRRAWSSYEKNAEFLLQTFSHDQIMRFNLEGAHDFWEQIRHNQQGKADTWAIFWYATIFKRGGYCLFPRQTLVENIGQDGTGEHCLATDVFRSDLMLTPLSVVEIHSKESSLAYSRVQGFYRANRLGRWRRLWLVSWQRLQRYLKDMT